LLFPEFFPTDCAKQVPYEKKDDFKKMTLAKKLNFGWDGPHRLWFIMTTDPSTIAEIVAEGYEVLQNPHEE
jgi:hypothetical protein